MTSKQCGDGDDDDDLVTRETKEGERKVFQRALCPDPPHCWPPGLQITSDRDHHNDLDYQDDQLF